MTDANLPANDLLNRLDRLERQVKRQRLVGVSVGVLLLVLAGIYYATTSPAYLRVRGITIVDAQGRSRILLGAPPDTTGRRRQDAATASLVILGPQGQDRVLLGEAPNPVLQGTVYPALRPPTA